MDALYFFLLRMTVDRRGAGGALSAGRSRCAIASEKHPVATQIEGSTLLEATWTIIPLAHLPGGVCVGRAAVLPHLRPAGQRDEHLHRGQAVDVEGGAPGRAA